MVGVRGGVNFADYSFVPTRIGDTRFTPGAVRAGLTWASSCGSTSRSTSICNRNWTTPSSITTCWPRTPGAAASAAHRAVRDSRPAGLPVRRAAAVRRRAVPRHGFRAQQRPQALKVRFNNGDVGVMGGLGFNIRKFFIDFRISGYPRSRVWVRFTTSAANSDAASSSKMPKEFSP